MKAGWINLGGIMALIDESGRLTGALHPMDEQIRRKIVKSLYDPPISFSKEEYSLLGKPPDRDKTA